MRSPDAVIEAYDRLLASIGQRSGDIEPRPLVSHWAHVGSAYRGLVIVGQALRGWADEWQASEARTVEGRHRIIATTRAQNTDRPDPLDWVPSHPKVKNSPFWTFSRHLTDELEPDPVVPWYARYAWVNLYPVAPLAPPGNPTGPLWEAQEHHVGALLRAVVDWLEADRVVVVVGPQFWHPAASDAGLADLERAKSPLIAAGRVNDRQWVIGYHPKWASFQHLGAARYAALVSDAIRGR
jgi:hypothetical protein